jgi:hypothetical protein
VPSKISPNEANTGHGATSVKRADLAELVRRGEMSPEQARHHAVADVLKRMPFGIMESLAVLARVPERPRERRWFRRVVLDVLFDIWEMQEDVDESVILREDKSFSTAVDILKSARQAIAKLGKSFRAAYWMPILNVEDSIDRFLEIVGEAEPIRPRRRGRPKGKVKNRASHEFALRLLKCASLAGGNLSLEKNIPQGTLIEAIKLLRPYLPHGFTDKLSPSTLQRIKTSHQKWLRESQNAGPQIQ